jgi:Holliday junction DNA helicase RuvB
MAKVIENQNSKNLIFFDKNKEDFLSDFNPNSFNEYIGQKQLKERLYLYVTSAKQRNTCLDHMILFGPPGLGKTTLASIIAKEMGKNLKITSGPTLKKSGDLVAILSNLKENDIFFIDEIHRLMISIEETLYSAMEQFKVDIIIGQGPSAKTVSLPIAPFTLIGATTKMGLLSAPLRSRFGIVEKFDWYDSSDIAEIIKQTATFFDIKITNEAALKIASCSRGTPRIAKKLMRRIRDYVIVNENSIADEQSVDKAMNFFGVMKDGLTSVDLQILKIIYNRPFGAPIGIEAISTLIGEEVETIEDVYEPFLLQRGYIERTPRGRILNVQKKLEIGILINENFI